MSKTLRNFILFVILCRYSVPLTGQITQPAGTPIMQLITDFHLNLNDTAKTTGFGISRAYFGYNYQVDNYFSCRMILNIGSPEDMYRPPTPRRYAFFREASVTYARERLHVSFGITTTRHFDYLQKFWGKRFVANEFEVRNNYGYIADLGVVLDYDISEKVTVDMSVTNGEGYSQIQLDNGVKVAAGVIYRPDNHYMLRFYNDLNNNDGVNQYTASAFAGVDNRYINFGASFHFKTNMDRIEGHHGWGVSSTGSVKLPHDFEIFTRYDFSGSVRLPDDPNPWNYMKDSNLVIFGLQKTINAYCKLAIDYQDNIPYSTSLSSSGFLFLNALFKL